MYSLHSIYGWKSISISLSEGNKGNKGNMGNRNAVGMVGQGKFIMIDEKKVVFSYKPQTIVIPGVRFDRTTLRL